MCTPGASGATAAWWAFNVRAMQQREYKLIFPLALFPWHAGEGQAL